VVRRIPLPSPVCSLCIPYTVCEVKVGMIWCWQVPRSCPSTWLQPTALFWEEEGVALPSRVSPGGGGQAPRPWPEVMTPTARERAIGGMLRLTSTWIAGSANPVGGGGEREEGGNLCEGDGDFSGTPIPRAQTC